MINSLAIVIPIYKTTLNLLEQFSVDYLMTKTTERKIFFVAPRSLDLGYYRKRYFDINFELFEDHFFLSISGYNELLLHMGFYERFVKYDFMLIHQTDALLFKDNLTEWMNSGYAYIGAPWPMAMVLNLNAELAEIFNGNRFEAFVGNGGFSLRSVSKSIFILKETNKLLSFWREHKLNEDCFFAFAGILIEEFSIPKPDVAARFALELNPSQYMSPEKGEFPTGCHAWWKHDFAFWQRTISVVG
jgi:hypothetical protein